MAKFPKDAPKRRVVKALERLGFRMVREHEHISMVRDNADGTQTPSLSLKPITTRPAVFRTMQAASYSLRNADKRGEWVQ